MTQKFLVVLALLMLALGTLACQEQTNASGQQEETMPQADAVTPVSDEVTIEAAGSEGTASGRTYNYVADIKPIMEEFCLRCHDKPESPDGINFNQYADEAAFAKDTHILEEIVEVMEKKSMPPTGFPAPTEEQREILITWSKELPE